MRIISYSITCLLFAITTNLVYAQNENEPTTKTITVGANTVYLDPHGYRIKRDEFNKLAAHGHKVGFKTEGDTLYLELSVISNDVTDSNTESEYSIFPAYEFNFLNNEEPSKNIRVYNFWYTGCKPCLEEMPALNKIVEKYGDIADFIAPTWNDKQQVEDFIEKRKFDYKIAYNAQNLIGDLNINVYPAHMIVVDNKIVLYLKGSGDESLNVLTSELKKLKNEFGH